MINKKTFTSLIPAYILIIVLLIAAACFTERSVTVLSENIYFDNRPTLVIDAGHGGVDGGATSVSGVLESNINLKIALKLSALVQLLGIKSVMIRESDCSIHTEGESIAAKKVSDLKNRVKIINRNETALFVSIHQNYFFDDRYNGAQVFYNNVIGSRELAESMQAKFIETVNQRSHRCAKAGSGIYLLKNSTCPGVLVECGFISNYEEDRLLNNSQYQNKICCIIATECSKYLFNNNAS